MVIFVISNAETRKLSVAYTYLSLVASRLHQDSKVSNLMRNFMKEYCESSNYAKIATHKK